MGGGSLGGSQSDSDSSFSEEVWGGQANPLRDLYEQAGNLFGDSSRYTGILDQLAGRLTPEMEGVFQGGLGGYEQMLGGGAYGDTSDIRNQLMDSLRSTSGGSNVGRMYESIVGGEGNTYIDPMVDAMKQGGMENLERMQSSAGLDATAAGQGGGSRHAMQNAMLARGANQDMMNKESMMRGGAYDKDLQMKMDIARQADQGVQGTQDRLLQMLSGADSNVQQGMNMGQGMQNLGMGMMAPWQQAMMNPWTNMNQYANVIGSPTILGSGRSSSSSKGLGGSGYAGSGN